MKIFIDIANTMDGTVADVATIPCKVLIQMTRHPLTDTGIEWF